MPSPMPVGERYGPSRTAARSAMPGPLIADRDQQSSCGAVLPSSRNSTVPAAGVLEGVARDLRHRGRDARLVLAVEAEQRRDLARALAREHDVALVANRHLEKSAASRALPQHDDGRVVAAAAEVAIEDRRRSASDGAPRAPDSGRSVQSRDEPVGVQHEQPHRRATGTELLDPADVVAGGAVVRDQAPGSRPSARIVAGDVPDAGEADDAPPAVDLGDRDGGAARRSRARRGSASRSPTAASRGRWRKIVDRARPTPPPRAARDRGRRTRARRMRSGVVCERPGVARDVLARSRGR